MENHGLGTQNDKMLRFQLEIPQINNNLFGPFTPINLLFGICLKNVLITCPLSMFWTNLITKNHWGLFRSLCGLNIIVHIITKHFRHLYLEYVEQ